MAEQENEITKSGEISKRRAALQRKHPGNGLNRRGKKRSGYGRCD